MKLAIPFFKSEAKRAPCLLRKDPVFVLGAHRSGTSVLAGMLEPLALSVGRTVMPPSEENPKGYYENKAVTDLHDQFFAQIRRCWSDPVPLEAAQFEGRAARRFRRDLPPLLETEFGDTRPLIKDPRLCVLLPLWLPLMQTNFPEARFVLPIRHPLEVAFSLRKRDRFILGHGLAIWTIHVLEAERATRSFPRFFSSYEELLGSPVETLRELAQGLGLPITGISPAIEQQVDLNLRHHRQLTWPPDEPHEDLMSAIHRTLTSHAPGMERELDRLRQEYYRRLAASPPAVGEG